MPVTQKLLLCVPTLPLAIMIVAISVILSVLGLFLVKRLVPHQKLKSHNDVAGAIFGTFGVMYAVLLAFAVIITWENFDKISLNVEKEANCIADIYRMAGGLSDPMKSDARTRLIEYAKSITHEEWPVLAKGEASKHTSDLMKGIWALYSSYAPKTETERIFFEESVGKLDDVSELRRMRIVDSSKGIHPVLWVVLLIGNAATIIFTFFFGSENFKSHFIMTILLTILMALILFTILLFDFPFTGDVSISAAPFKAMLLIS
ncbi:MAG: DUF4239 domain-containing protein [Candidatus Omnitrophota bacterium]|jgi:hypothetical protein